MAGISRGLRGALLLAGLAVGYASFVLSVFPDRSADLFAWDIRPPVTAAFMGAMYVTAIPLLFLLARPGTRWRQVRPVLPALLALSSTMLVATLLHTDRFLWSKPITWAWLILYIAYPPLVLSLYVSHARRDAGDGPVAWPVEPWFRASAFLAAAVIGSFGLGLLVLPRTFDALWPWPLTPLTGRVVGGWLVFLATALASLGRERDWDVIRPILAEGPLVFGLLCLGVVRFRDAFDADRLQTWFYVGFVVGGLALTAGLVLTHAVGPATLSKGKVGKA